MDSVGCYNDGTVVVGASDLPHLAFAVVGGDVSDLPLLLSAFVLCVGADVARVHDVGDHDHVLVSGELVNATKSGSW